MNAITESFHLINTARAGLALLDTQVARVVAAGAHDKVIEALYSMPDGATGQNLRAHAAQQQTIKDRALAEMWLMVVFARYEAWAESLETEHSIRDAKRGCQFPLQTSGGLGYVQVFSVLTPDALMRDIYESSVVADHLWLRTDSDAQAALEVYRYYKEVRNSLVHSDGRANARLASASATAQGALVTLRNNTTLRTSSVPLVALGDPIVIDLGLVRDVIDLLRRLVFTIDAKILLSTIGLDQFISRWREKYGSQPLNVNIGKLGRPAWFQAAVSNALSVPAPAVAGSTTGATWPATSRRALVDYGVSNWLIRKLL
ncbi:hypothetical protein AB4Z18_13650 [Leifsonia sp. 2TAF2]|uniref:hypothetical protein n=1 Tax=Leifsonia sp. 2TAF2 TaxID=3233009 RepID=UPI003F9AB200